MNAAIRHDAETIFRAALEGVEPTRAVTACLCRQGGAVRVYDHQQAFCGEIDLEKIRRVFVVGCGKAGAPMSAAVERVFGKRIVGGVVAVKYGHTRSYKPDAIQIIEAGHPEPDANGAAAAEKTCEILDRAGAGDLVAAVISGGGSALWADAIPGVSLDELQAATRALLRSGASIGEINAIRKRLSALKGGRAARRAYPAAVLALAISDVPGDDLSAIASGPFTPDTATIGDARRILAHYGMLSALPASIQRIFNHDRSRGVEDQATASDTSACAKVISCICASNRDALRAASKKAREKGYEPVLIDRQITGEAQSAAHYLTAEYQRISREREGPLCILSGGETTVTLPASHGLGGRNQELALAASLDLAKMPGWGLLSCGADGADGPTDAAGAWCETETVERAAQLGLRPRAFLQRHASYRFFDSLNDLVKTGPTATNVMDLQIALRR